MAIPFWRISLPVLLAAIVTTPLLAQLGATVPDWGVPAMSSGAHPA
jgi:hypothetical protein